MNTFDCIINRKYTNSYKWDLLKYDNEISLSIADMDFKLPQKVLIEMHKRIDYGIFGYEYEGSEYYLAFVNWMKKRHMIDIPIEWIVCVSGVITGIKIVITAFTKEEDSILVQTPVYHAYYDAIDNNNRKIICNELINRNGRYEIDFENFEKVIKEENVKLFILCNPHNPVGRAWSINEISKMVEICKKYLVMVVSDEVYHDFVFNKEGYNSCLKFNANYDKIIVATSPCKSFNVAGIHVANYIIPNKTVREEFVIAKRKCGYISNNALGIKLCESLYMYGEEWLNELVKYIKSNIKIVQKYFKENFSKIIITHSEALYLMWIDFSFLEIDYKELERIFLKEIHVEVSQGYLFGIDGEMFIRMNVACSKSILKEALRRIGNVLPKYYNKNKVGE